MSKAKDKFGNDLEVGDFVQLELPVPIVYGRIVEITPGGMHIVGGSKRPQDAQEMITLGRVKVAFEGYADFDPRNLIAGGAALIVDPTPDAKREIQKKANMKSLLD